jgi:hypothetical protein
MISLFMKADSGEVHTEFLGPPKTHYPVIHPGNDVTGDEAGEKSISESNQAAKETHLISDEKVSEQREMRAYDIPALEDEPIRGNEYHNTNNDARHNALDGRIESQQPCQDDLFKNLFVVGHGSV